MASQPVTTVTAAPVISQPVAVAAPVEYVAQPMVDNTLVATQGWTQATVPRLHVGLHTHHRTYNTPRGRVQPTSIRDYKWGARAYVAQGTKIVANPAQGPKGPVSAILNPPQAANFVPSEPRYNPTLTHHRGSVMTAHVVSGYAG